VNAVGKSNLLLVSLVAALPAGYLCYEMVNTFLNRSEGLETIMLVLAGITLTGSSVVALSPVGILLFSPSAADVAQRSQDAAAQGGADDMDDDDDGLEVDDDFGDADEMNDDENFEFDDDDDDDWE